MSKARIKLVTIGYLPQDFHLEKIIQWNSKVFQLAGNVETYALRRDSDSEDWQYSDSLICEIVSKIPTKNDSFDFFVTLVNVPIENGWYTRLFDNNNVVITLHEIKGILNSSNIPIENVVLRLLYAYALLFRQFGNRIPRLEEGASCFHEETRGCLFDFTADKNDLPASCDSPQICDACQERLKTHSVSNNEIEHANKEIRRIKKDFYFSILGFVKKHPILSIIVSSIYALLLNFIASAIYK